MSLNNLSKKELIEKVNQLQMENSVLKELQAFMKLSNERLEKLEREQNWHFQYQRRNSIEITGIPESVDQKDLEDEVVNIFKVAGVKVNGRELDNFQMQACHRIGKKGITIVKFVNRKFAYEGLRCGRNLKGKEIFGANSKVYINNSFCREYQYLNYCVRKAKSNNKIFRWKVKHGVNLIQVDDGGDFIEITHKNDLIKLGIIDE